MRLLRSLRRPKKRPLPELELEMLEQRVMLSTVELFAAGTDGGEQMELQIDGTTVDTWNLLAGADTGQYQTYQYTTPDTLSIDQLRVVFANDSAGQEANFNLRLDAVAIDGVRYETEAPTVFSSGTLLPGDAPAGSFPQSEYLHANGYFQFGVDPTGPIAHWTFEETAIGQTVVDSSGFGNDGTHVNITPPDGPSSNAAVGNQSLSVDGVDDYVSIASDPSLDLSGGQFTQSVWILPEITDDGFHGVIGYQGDGFLKRYPGIWVKQQDKIHAGFGDGTEVRSFSTPSVLTPSAWNHVVTTFDGNEYKVYVNGQEVFVTTEHAGTSPYPTQTVEIGRVDNQFDGNIDDVRIYQRALDASEVNDLFNTNTSTLTVTIADSSISEGDGAAATTGTVTRSGDLTGALVVALASSDATEATVPTSVTIEAGQASASFDIDAVDDAVIDGTVAVVITASAPGTFNGAATINVTDNEVASGPVGHWMLEETAIGQTVVDSSGFGNDGTHVNITPPDGPSTDAAVGGYSLSVDGVDDYISIASDPSLDLSGGQFTQSVWILPELTDDGFHGVLGYQGDGLLKRYPGIWVKQQDKIHAGFGDGTDVRSFSTPSVLSPSEWNHVVTTFDGNEYKVYVNGQEVFVTTEHAGTTPYPTQTVNIGRVDNQFEGKIDDVRIYQRALDASEVSDLFTTNTATLTLTIADATISEGDGPSATTATVTRSGDLSSALVVALTSSDTSEATVPSTVTIDPGQSSASFDIDAVDDVLIDGTVAVAITASAPGFFEGAATVNVTNDDTSSGPVAHWTFEETAIGQTVVDSSGFGNDGTHVNITPPDGPSSNAAVGNQSLSVDGVDDYVSIASDPSLDLSGGQFTQSVWILPEITDDGFHGVIGYQGDGFLKRYPGIWVKQQDKIHAGFGDGTEVRSFSTPSVLTPSAWNHVVTTFDGNEYKVYVNGQEVFVTTEHAGTSPYPTQTVEIGRVDNQFEGNIDDVRIYQRALDASEVSLLFDEGASDPGTIEFAETAYVVSESDGTVSIEFSRVGGDTGTVTANYSTSDGSAAAPADYTSTSGTLTFLDGEVSQTIEIPISNDSNDEPAESFTLSLAGGGSATITIIDDDRATIGGQDVYQRDGHLYLLTSSATSWTSAQQEAESVGGNLVTINDAAEEAWLQTTFGFGGLWIGINDADNEGQFVWASGEVVTYTNWASGQPNNSGGQDYGRMNYQSGQQWNDESNNQSYFGVIEIGQGAETVQNGLLAEYYDNIGFTNLFTSRIDPTVDFDWGTGAPIAGMGADTFSVRWTGQVRPEFSETYTFRTRSDDGIRLWVDDQLIIDEWNDHPPTLHTGTISLQAGQLYNIRLEHYENGGQAVAELEWSSASQSLQIIPQSRLFAAGDVSENPNGTGFSTEVIASGLNQPVSYAVAPDGRIFVAEKAGLVKVIDNGVVVSTFLDINEEVQSGHDRGLLGIALDPDFENTGHVYLNFSEEINPGNPDDSSQGSDAAGRLIRISASTTNPNVADESTRVDVLTGHQMTHYTHSVGDVDFDNQGNLIFTWGDGGFDPNLRLEAQDENSKQGKLFRLNRFTFEGVPDNPFYDANNPNSTASKVWAVGVRNSWKLTVDRATGDVYMGEVTDGGPEEINVMRADGSTIRNYGWPYYEDNIRTNYGSVPSNFTYERAFIALPHTNAGGGDAILGGAVFRGDAYPDVYDGRYFFANFNQGIIYTADSQTGAYQPFGNPGDYTGVVDMQLGPDGHMWIMNLFTGQIERLVSDNPGNNNTEPTAVVTASTTAGVGPLLVTLDAGASSDADGDPLSYAWDFDSDGIIDAVGSTVTHLYTAAGRTTTTVFVYDGQGGIDTQIVEIDVVSNPVAGNVALGRSAIQSGSEFGGIASRAVDGDTNGDFSAGSVTHTDQTRTPLWEVDLGQVYDISQIELYNRTDGGLGSRLNDYWVLVSDNPFVSGNLDAARSEPGVLSFYNPGTAGNVEIVTVNGTGRYVRIQLAGVNDILSLAEVRVFAV